MVSLSRKTSCAAQVALQHCPILHMSKRKSMIPTGFHTVNWLNPLRKPGSKPSGQVAQLAPDRRLRRTGISKRAADGGLWRLLESAVMFNGRFLFRGIEYFL